MSIKIKLPFFILLAMLCNFLLIVGYYHFYLSTQISETSNEVQEELQKETDRISAELKNRGDAVARLEKISETEHLLILVQDETGNILFQSGNKMGVKFEHRASALFPFQGKICILQIIKGVSITNLSAFQNAHDLLTTELGIIFIVLVLSGVYIYVRYAKQVVSLQKKMERYQSGIRPERVKRRDEIGQLQNRFADLTDALEEEKQKQDRIIVSISHDIKTPLTSVMGYAERLKKKSLTEEKREQYVDTIYRKSVVIKSLIDDFDEYLSYHAPSSLRKQLITVEQLGQVLQLEYGEELRERGVPFSLKIGCPQVKLAVDLSKIRRVFGNLIDNSLNHRSKTPLEISVVCKREDSSVIFSVEDNGTGVKNEEELRKIFEPFFTSDKARTFAGLGLSICQEIIEAHGGSICAENRREGGLRVIFCLPEECGTGRHLINKKNS
ncbi:Adaptive-response sensory-kinase SasA [Caprobacter fermentans]|uniref:histidine kinase n=1 Tax=Caproicibacter fermentans TaxID=2576756 RepID=A0A6N8HXC1_9FIRM|nr:Adaptive-response sensory-kinase SasA [Caproicibacter fermentans]